MEKQENTKANKNSGTGCAIVFFIAFLIIFLPILINLVSNNIENSNNAKHETKLIEEGKIKTPDKIVNEIIEILKNKDENKLKEYLVEDFKYYDVNNTESKYVSAFINDLQILFSSYDIERRGDTSRDDIVAYRIYWNVVEENKALGRTNQYYCLQKITIMLKRVVKQEIITYEIEKIILTDN